MRRRGATAAGPGSPATGSGVAVDKLSVVVAVDSSSEGPRRCHERRREGAAAAGLRSLATGATSASELPAQLTLGETPTEMTRNESWAASRP